MNAHTALVAILVAASAACSTAGSEARSEPRVALLEGTDAIEVTGLSSRDLDRLRGVSWEQTDWERLLRVTVASDDGAQAMLGTYAVTADALRFTPRFPFDPGRPYYVRLDPSRLPGAVRWPMVTVSVGRPAPPAGPPTDVLQVYPSGGTLAENQLRMYVQFSAPMGRRGALEHMRILDEAGKEVEDPFLPLDTDLWNHDATRLTVLFDPGRVKRGILPNVEMGRALRPGERYTLVISQAWTDAQGRPLASEFRRTFRVAPPDEHPIDVAAWRIDPPGPDSRDPVTRDIPEAARSRSSALGARRRARRSGDPWRHLGRTRRDALAVHSARSMARRTPLAGRPDDARGSRRESDRPRVRSAGRRSRAEAG